jgi:hypothetical protein
MELDDLDNEFTKFNIKMVFTLTIYEDYRLVQKSYLQDFKLCIDKSYVVISIVLDLKIEVCKSENK